MTSKSRPKKRLSPARKDLVLRQFAASMDQGELNTVLAYSGDPRAEQLLSMLLDPAFRRHSFPKLCERVGLRQADLIDLFRGHYTGLAVIRALRHLPEVVEDLCKAAKSSLIACPRCDGRGDVKDDQEPGGVRRCPQCTGSCEVEVPGDYRARDQFLRMVGLLQ